MKRVNVAPELRKKLIDEFIDVRKKYGLTQAQVAEMLGLQQVYISRFENDLWLSGVSVPSLKSMLGFIGYKLDISIEDDKKVYSVYPMEKSYVA